MQCYSPKNYISLTYIRETVIIMNVIGARGGISRWLPGGIWFIVATPSSNEVPSLTLN